MTAITGEAAVPAVNEPRRVPSPIELYEARVRTSWVRMPGLLSSKAPSVQLSSRATTTTIAIPPGISNRRRLSIACNEAARANFFTYPGEHGDLSLRHGVRRSVLPRSPARRGVGDHLPHQPLRGLVELAARAGGRGQGLGVRVGTAGGGRPSPPLPDASRNRAGKEHKTPSH